MDFDITSDEINWLQRTYPKLTYQKGSPSVIKGTLELKMVYLGDRYIINPSNSEELEHPQYLKDSYQIEIIFQKMPASMLPGVKETGGRIKKAKDKYKKRFLADVHMYESEHLCLSARAEEDEKLPNGFMLEDFFNIFLIPFFYGQSYFEKTGTWIWGERSHGCLGIFESYFEFRDPTYRTEFLKKYITDLQASSDLVLYAKALSGKRRIKGHWLCFCGSQKKFRKCHNLAFKGMWNLKEDLKRSKLKVYNLMSGYYKNWQEYQKSA